MTQNEISHYESLKKQDTANRKLIKKLQLDKQALKEQLILSGVSQHRELLLGFKENEYFDLYEQGEVSFKNAIEMYLTQ